MGTADIIPGVSGGTIALISGIYDHFILALSSPKLSHLRDLAVFALLVVRRMPLLLSSARRSEVTASPEWKQVTSRLMEIQWSFLIPLLLGIMVGLVAMSQVIPFLMQTYTFLTFSFFFGLILFSLTIPFGMMRKAPLEFFVLVMFTLGMFLLVGYSQLFEGSLHPLFLFLSGAIAVCAMVLPGISGAFILVVLGEYALVLGTFREVVHLNNLAVNLQTMGFFVAGVLVGVFSFVRLLRYLLRNFHSVTMAALTGFMVGSLRKIWPFSYNAGGFELSYLTLGGLVAAIAGAALVFGLERLSVVIADPEPPIHDRVP